MPAFLPSACNRDPCGRQAAAADKIGPTTPEGQSPWALFIGPANTLAELMLRCLGNEMRGQRNCNERAFVSQGVRCVHSSTHGSISLSQVAAGARRRRPAGTPQGSRRSAGAKPAVVRRGPPSPAASSPRSQRVAPTGFEVPRCPFPSALPVRERRNTSVRKWVKLFPPRPDDVGLPPDRRGRPASERPARLALGSALAAIVRLKILNEACNLTRRQPIPHSLPPGRGRLGRRDAAARTARRPSAYSTPATRVGGATAAPAP